MKILNILRSEPDEMIRMFIQGTTGELDILVQLYRKPVDYDQLVREIFDSDKVISWW